ncbi:hypothetical protein E2C01_043518 [Portunus trituberculatus]|uniref:Uncharacterized protein n=1 Tax=Portunus trituberculatus TaxID=210409 RepID=A0A5B7FVY3_PORTR|nr:hypothetical protein [Portunus trituberculatus]
MAAMSLPTQGFYPQHLTQLGVSPRLPNSQTCSAPAAFVHLPLCSRTDALQLSTLARHERVIDHGNSILPAGERGTQLHGVILIKVLVQPEREAADGSQGLCS